MVGNQASQLGDVITLVLVTLIVGKAGHLLGAIESDLAGGELPFHFGESANLVAVQHMLLDVR
jgi:hypothetical protein